MPLVHLSRAATRTGPPSKAASAARKAVQCLQCTTEYLTTHRSAQDGLSRYPQQTPLRVVIKIEHRASTSLPRLRHSGCRCARVRHDQAVSIAAHPLSLETTSSPHLIQHGNHRFAQPRQTLLVVRRRPPQNRTCTDLESQRAVTL